MGGSDSNGASRCEASESAEGGTVGEVIPAGRANASEN